MKLLASVVLCAMPVMVVSAAPAPKVPVGTFLTWSAHSATPLRFRSGSLTIKVAAQPCPPKPQTEGCSYGGVNNQAAITVSAPDMAPFSMTSDGQASFVRLAAVQIDRRDPRPGVVVDNQWGGSAGLTTVTVIEPVPGGYRAVAIQRRTGGRQLEGELADGPVDRSGDGRIDLVLNDAAFDGTFGCNACTPRPPVVLTVREGRAVDLSAEPSVRAVFTANVAPRRAFCLSDKPDRNGNCAAYVADAARLGQLRTAWSTMLAHYEHGTAAYAIWQSCDLPPDQRPRGACPPDHASHYRTFPESLRAFLVVAGYVTRAEAAALPLAA